MVLWAKVKAIVAARLRRRLERLQPPCPHPEDDRLSAARMGHPHAFICRRCGHREDC